MTRVLVVATVLAALAAGCARRTLPELDPIPVAPGRTLQQLEEALRQAVQRSKFRDRYKWGEWHVEKSEPGRLVTGIWRRRPLRLRRRKSCRRNRRRIHPSPGEGRA